MNMTVRDRRRVLAADAVANRACDEAVESMLNGICTAIDDYGVGHARGGAVYYQRLLGERGVLRISGGTLIVSGGKAGIAAYCREILAAHEDALAKVMAEGTDDLLHDLCVETAHECTPEGIAAIPDEGLPRHRVLTDG